MKLRIQTRKQFIGEKDKNEFYYQVDELEIESFMWGVNHEFQYVVKGSCVWSKLKPNQEIVGLSI